MWNDELDRQQPFEHMLKDHMPKGLTFYEYYTCYPEVIVEHPQPNELKPLVEQSLRENGFTVEMVELEPVMDEDSPELRLIFDLTIFTKEQAKRCLEVVAETIRH